MNFLLANSFALFVALIFITVVLALFSVWAMAFLRARKRKQTLASFFHPPAARARLGRHSDRHCTRRHRRGRILAFAFGALAALDLGLWTLDCAAQPYQTGQPNFAAVVSNYTGIVLAAGAGTNFNTASNQIVQHFTINQKFGDTWYWSGCGSTATTTNTYTIYFATAAWNTGLQYTNSAGANTNFTTGNTAALASGASQNFPLSWSISLNGTNYITVKTNFPWTLLEGDREIYPVLATNACSGNVTNFYLVETHSNQ
jgi:hypothetical protein